MAPWTFDIKFHLGTQFTFGSLMFTAGEDGDLKMLPPGPASEHPALAPSSTLGGACSGLDPFIGLYICTAKLVRDIPIVMSILRPFVGASSLSLSASSPDRDSSHDYPKIGASAYENSTKDGCLILMVATNRDQSRNSSSGYLTIGRSEASDARTPSTGLVRNLNLDFNAVQVEAIMETIQRMAPDGSPFAVLAQQGDEAVNLIITEKSTGVPQTESSDGHNDRARRARNEATSLVSLNQHLAENYARQCITQNCNAREYGRGRMTFATSSKVGGASGSERQVHHDDL
jgi:hypothetical protein